MSVLVQYPERGVARIDGPERSVSASHNYQYGVCTGQTIKNKSCKFSRARETTR